MVLAVLIRRGIRRQALALLLPVLALAVTLSDARAQAVYKCERGGQVSYSQMPCDGGRNEALQITPEPTSATL